MGHAWYEAAILGATLHGGKEIWRCGREAASLMHACIPGGISNTTETGHQVERASLSTDGTDMDTFPPLRERKNQSST